MGGRRDFFGLTPVELAGALGGTGRARACWSAVRNGRAPLDTEELGWRARRRFDERLAASPLRLIDRALAADGTVKLLLGLQDGARIETVVIPGPKRATVCVSTQVGCGRGCTFCVTATLGLTRNLSAAEIVAQVHAANLEARGRSMPPLRNIVYMGMGEPLDNLDAVRASTRILTDHRAFAMPANHLTVSTIGTSPRAIRAAADLPGNLAWSLHTVEDEERRRLVPTVKHSLTELRAAFVDVMCQRRAILFIEMTLIAGVNDSIDHAEALHRFIAPFRPEVRVNLLPLNAGRHGLDPTPAERVAAYQQHLRDRDTFCATRRPRGADASAACGQLAARRAPA